MTLPRNLLWVDCTAGGLVGVAVLLLGGWLARLYALPYELVVGMGVANLAYAAFSFSLARRRPPRPRGLILTLIVANAVWAVVCFALAVYYSQSASALGLASLIGEGLFVGGLAGLEWTRREQMVTAP